MWIEGFYEIFFSDDVDLETKRKCIEFKNRKIPDSLFKYTSTKFLEDKILYDKIYLPKLEELNDPIEGYIAFNEPKLQETVIGMIKENSDSEKWSDELLDRVYNHVIYEENFFEIKSKEFTDFYSVICLTEKNRNYPMWAHYADDYNGICIEYDLKDSKRDDLIWMCYPIRYVDEPDKINSESKYLVQDDVIYHEHLLKKPTDWKYEKEWRIIICLKENNDFRDENVKYQLKFIKPKSIYMGFKIGEDDEKRITEICESRNINLYKGKFIGRKYGLQFEPILEY